MRPIVINSHERPITCVRYNRDGDLVFVGCQDSYVSVWWTNPVERLGTYACEAAVSSLSISEDSTILLVCNRTGKVFLWNIETGEKFNEFNVQGLLKTVEFAMGSKQFLVLGNSGLGATSNTLKVYETRRALEVKEPIGKILMKSSSEKLTVAIWGYLNKAIYVATERGNLFHIDATVEGEPINQLALHEREVTSINFNKDYTLLITSSKDGFCKILNPETLEVLKSYNGARPINRAIFSPLMVTGEKFHALCAGGQEARDVTTTKAEVRLM